MKQQSSIASQRIIYKNTVMLYIRMAVIMVVSLYTSRVVLNTLGIIDYGIYNVVGSVVVSLAFVSNSLMSSTQRYLSFQLGRGSVEGTRKVFNTSLIIHIAFAVVIVVLLETIGLWVLNHVLSIPEERMSAANVAYQLSILTFCINFLRIPYNAAIIAEERMTVFAVFSIAEAVLKLGIVFLLVIGNFDRLIYYCVLFAIVTFLINVMYVVYCHLQFKDVCKLTLQYDKALTKDMMNFSGWTLFGGLTGVATNEGPGYFMNYFIGVQMNAAMGIAKQVGNAVYSFASSFQTAFNPQIVKLYSANEQEQLKSLVFRSSKLSYALINMIALPIILCAPRIFNLWLVEVPDYAIILSILLMLSQMIAAIASPLWMLAHAAGNIKKYQLTIGIINLLILPVSWAVLFLGFEPYWILAFLVLLNIAILVFRVSYLKQTIDFPAKEYYGLVVLKCLVVTALSAIIPILIKLFIDSFWGDCVVMLIAIVSVAVCFYYIGMTQREREVIHNWVITHVIKKNTSESYYSE